MTDNRVVLPLDRVTVQAWRFCEEFCGSLESDTPAAEHDDDCLVPLLDERKRLLAAATEDGLTPDCRDGKHVACVGCICDCHRHSRRVP